MRGILGYFYPSLHIIITWVKRGFVAAINGYHYCVVDVCLLWFRLSSFFLYILFVSLSPQERTYIGEMYSKIEGVNGETRLVLHSFVTLPIAIGILSTLHFSHSYSFLSSLSFEMFVKFREEGGNAYSLNCFQ